MLQFYPPFVKLQNKKSKFQKLLKDLNTKSTKSPSTVFDSPPEGKRMSGKLSKREIHSLFQTNEYHVDDPKSRKVFIDFVEKRDFAKEKHIESIYH